MSTARADVGVLELQWLITGKCSVQKGQMGRCDHSLHDGNRVQPRRPDRLHESSCGISQARKVRIPLTLLTTRYEDVERDCTAALRLDEQNLKALYRRALARRGMRRVDEAKRGE